MTKEEVAKELEKYTTKEVDKDNPQIITYRPSFKIKRISYQVTSKGIKNVTEQFTRGAKTTTDRG